MHKLTSNNLIVVLGIILTALCASWVVAYYSYMGLMIVVLFVLAIIIFTLILKNPFWGFLLLVFFLPFERIPTIDIGLFTLKINQILAIMTIISWILSMMFGKRKVMPNPLTWPIIVFLLVNFISIFVAGNTMRSVEVFVFIAFMVIVSFLTVNMVDSKNALKIIVKVLFWSTLVVCFFALYQFLGDLIGLPTSITGLDEGYTKAVFGFPRVMAFSKEPLYLADYLFIPLGICIALFLSKIKTVSKNVLILLMILILFVIVLTVSRGAYVGLAAMVIVFIVFMAKKVLTWKNVLITLLSITVVGLGTYYFLSKAEPQALDEFISHVTLQDISVGESTQGRLTAYEQALLFWQESPAIGIGVGNFGPKVKNFPDPSTVTGWDIVNNEYLEILSETGILGIICFICILVILFWRSIIAYVATKDLFLKSILLGLSAALVAILVQYNFFSTLYIMHIWFLIGLIIAVQTLCFIKET